MYGTHKKEALSFLPADGAYREGDIRLVGGAYNWEGRVEIYWMEEWGAISDSTWTAGDANVVCRQLQHSSENSKFHYTSPYIYTYMHGAYIGSFPLNKNHDL